MRFFILFPPTARNPCRGSCAVCFPTFLEKEIFDSDFDVNKVNKKTVMVLSTCSLNGTCVAIFSTRFDFFFEFFSRIYEVF